jgi:hypothetical protein
MTNLIQFPRWYQSPLTRQNDTYWFWYCFKKVLFWGAILWLLSTCAQAEADDACKLQMVVADNRLRLQVVCWNGIRHRDNLKIWEENLCAESKIDDIEQIDARGYLVHTTCGTKKTTLVIQLTDRDNLLVSGTENY